MNLLNKLRALEAAASPGPWKFERHPNPGQWINGNDDNNWQSWSYDITYKIIPPNYDGETTICDDDSFYYTPLFIEDAELLVEMRNNIKQLLDRLEFLEGWYAKQDR